jgi:hypothetical protein
MGMLASDIGALNVETADSGENLKLCRHKATTSWHDHNRQRQEWPACSEELLIGKPISHQCIFVMVTAESSQATVLSALHHRCLTKLFMLSAPIQRLDKLVERKAALKPILQALVSAITPRCWPPAAAPVSRKRWRAPGLRYQAGALRELPSLMSCSAADRVAAERRALGLYDGHGRVAECAATSAGTEVHDALQKFSHAAGFVMIVWLPLPARRATASAPKRCRSKVVKPVAAIRRQMQLGNLVLIMKICQRLQSPSASGGAQPSFKTAENRLV